MHAQINLFQIRIYINKFEIYVFSQIEHLSMSPNLKAIVGNQAKLLKCLVLILFDAPFLGTITWSGKAKEATKTALSKYKNVNEMMFSTVVAIDSAYKHQDFLANLKNKVLKYAYELVYNIYSINKKIISLNIFQILIF